jgi:hypothetical protein
MGADLKSKTAPLWINAFVYLLIGRLVCHSTSLACLPNYIHSSWHISTSFILLDILAFAYQTAGIVMATLPRSSPEEVLRGAIFTWRASVCSCCSLSYFPSRFVSCNERQRNRRGRERPIIVSGFCMPLFRLYQSALSFAWLSTRTASVPLSQGKRFLFIVSILFLCWLP